MDLYSVIFIWLFIFHCPTLGTCSIVRTPGTSSSCATLACREALAAWPRCALLKKEHVLVWSLQWRYFETQPMESRNENCMNARVTLSHK